MNSKIRQIIDFVPPARKALIIPALAFNTVIAPGGKNVYASSDDLFRGAIFGRDSLEVAEDIMRIRPNLAGNILLSLARLQGLTLNIKTEEEAGKIIHEYRTAFINGKRIDRNSLIIFKDLSQKWGGSDNEMAYYGSVDSTPHFLRTLAMYCSYYGDKILGQRISQRNGQIVTMLQVAEAAAAWITDKIAISKTGLLEFHRLNPVGIKNQVWKDSAEFYVHNNGQLANHDKPIASIEVQGLVYDALIAAACFFPHNSKKYCALARKIRDRTIELFWMPNSSYFALGYDYNADDTIRIIRTPAANAAALLDTKFFDKLPSADHQKYVSAIVMKIMSKDFLTAAGIRSRSLAAASAISFWDYHGSYVSWPKETYDIAKGLSRNGMPLLARQLENRLLNIVLKTHEYPEFVYVDEWGRVLTSRPAKSAHGELISVDGTNAPERIQAWTVSAIMAIIDSRFKKKLNKGRMPVQISWQKDIETIILNRIPRLGRYINPVSLSRKYPTHRYHLSQQKRN